MPENPLISIIIPYFNCPAIVDCLESLYRQTYGNIEIIVVNNNSSKNHLARLHCPRIRVATETIQSSYAARNRGIQCARGDYLAFIDADCTADKDWLKNLWHTATMENAEMVLGNVIKTISKKRRSCEYVDREIYHNHRRLFSQGSGTTANLLVFKGVVDRVSGFSAENFSGGDTKFIRYVVGLGASYAYAESAVVFHPCRKTLFSLMKKGFRTGVAAGNEEANRFAGFEHSMKYVRWRCLTIMNPFRRDIIRQARLRSIPYAFSYFMHFAAHGIGRCFGITSLSMTRVCRTLMRYT